MTKEQRAYLESLVEEVKREGLNGRTIEEAIREAHEKRQAFLLELSAGETERAQVIRRVICDEVWKRARARA